MNCEREGRSAEDPHPAASQEGWPVALSLATSLIPFHVLFLRHGGTIQCTVTGPIKYLYDLLQRGVELPCMY